MAVTLTVNGTELPEPAELTVDVQDVDYESGRNQTGYMFRDRVRGGANSPRKIEVKFPPLTMEEVSTVLQAVSGASMYLTYPDPYAGHFRTANVYVGDRKAPLYWRKGSDYLWKDVAFNFVEY